MIQRIQSIYLLLASSASFALFGLPFAKTSMANESGLFQDSVYSIFDNLGLIGIFVTAGLAALVAIFLYKNRNNQRRVGWISLVLSLLGIGLGIFLFIQDLSRNTQPIKDDFGLGMPVFSILFILMANRAIRKDEALVRSADRLR